MKRTDNRVIVRGGRICWLVWLSGLLVHLATPGARALPAENPYATIVERNAFALKPPTPPPVVTPPPTPASNVELRGITTLLGRPQVLLNFRVPGKPPELPKDRSLVMDVGQREGDVEVLEINPAAGTIRIRNQGNEVAMNLKDNASKPQVVPGLAAPAVPSPGIPSPGIPSPTAIPAPAAAASGVSTTTVGASARSTTLPSRNLRATGDTPAPVTAVEQAAIMEVERERTKTLVEQGKMPPLPPIPNLNK